jgi:hypothetical protein
MYVIVFILRLRAELTVLKGHPPLAPGVHPPAPSVIEGLPELFVNPAGVCPLFLSDLSSQCSQLIYLTKPKGLIWGPVPFIWNFVAAGAGWK